MLGTTAIVPVPLLATDAIATIQADISQHLTGNTAGMSMTADVSLDGGLTWAFIAGWARDKGYDNTALVAFMTFGLPDIGNPNRQLRGSITVTGSDVVTVGTVHAGVPLGVVRV